MRLRQAQQLQADVYALLDEKSGTNVNGYVSGVNPTPADVLESLNQQWCDIYGELVRCGITWNLQTSYFTTTTGQQTYGTGTAWTGGLAALAITAGGSAYTSAPTVSLTGGGGSGAQATAVVSGGAIIGLNITDTGQGYTTAPAVSFSGGGGTGAAATAAIGGSYWKTMGLDVQGANQKWRNAYQATFEQRNDYPPEALVWPYPVLYEIRGGTADATGADGTALSFTTVPQGVFNCRHYWFPAPQRLVNPTDVLDGVAGADRAIVLGAAQECALMLEQFEMADHWGQLRDAKVEKMISLLRDRNVGQAPMASIVRGEPTRRRYRGGGGWGGWGA